MTYAEALAWIAQSRARGVQPGLSRISRLLFLLGDPQDGLLLIHVAGTNGKGSTCACLEAGLRGCGVYTGMFISPWLVHVREMFRLDGIPVDEDLFARAATAVAAAESRMAAADAAGSDTFLEDTALPTEYELYTAMAFWLFREACCRVVVLETCMGGRYDTTNAYGGDSLAVLSHIEKDHTAFLGETLREITWHKAGIMRRGCPAVSILQEVEVAAVLEQCAAQTQTKLSFLAREAVSAVRLSPKMTQFVLTLPEPIGSDGWNGAYTVSLAGAFQAENATLAIAALRLLDRWKPELGLTSEAVRRGLRQVCWPCRFEVFPGSPRVIIDGAHNPDGMRRFVNTFDQLFPGRRAVVVLGVLRDKDVAGMLGSLLKITASLHLVRPDTPRGMGVDELEAIFLQSACCEPESACCTGYKHDTIQEAMMAGLRDAGPEGILVAVGSLSWTGTFRLLYRQWCIEHNVIDS